MKMKLSLKRVLSFLLVAVMVISMCPVIASAATDVTLTFKNGAAQDSANRYLLYFEGLADTADKYWNNNTVYIDGKEVSGDGVHYVHIGSDFALLLYYNAIEEGVTTASGMSQAHTVQIKAGTALAGGEYNIANDVWLKLDGTTVTQLTPVNLTLNSCIAQDTNTRLVISLGGFADTADKYWNNNTLYIDGVAVTDGVHYLPDSGDNIVLYLYYSAISADATSYASLGSHIVEIPAGTLLGSYVVNKAVKLQLNGGTATQIYDPDVTVTLSNDDSRNKDGGKTSGFYFYVSPTEELPYDTDNWTTKYSMTTGGIYLNDTLVSGAKLVKVTENLYYTAFDGCGITFAANDVVKIAGTVTSDGYTVEYTEQAFQYDGNGNWDIYVPVVGNNFALDESDPGGWQGGELNRYLVWLTDDISGEKTALGTVQLLVDGETKNVETYLSTDGRYALLLNATCGISALGEHTVQITAGQALGEYTVLNDAIFYTHADGSVNTTAPVYVTLSNDDSRNQDGGKTSGFYFYVSPTEELPYDTDNWTTKYSMTTGGIYLNDTLVSGAKLVKVTETLYYTAFDGCGITFAANDVVKIAGTVTSDGYTVVYTEQSFQYDGNGNWDIYTPPVYVDFALDESDPGCWQGGELNRYLIWLSDDISGEKTALGTVQLLVDGETKSVETYLSTEGRYALLLNATCGISALGEHTVQITAGQALGEYTVLNDAVFYTHADGSVNTTPPPKTTVTLGFDPNNAGAWQGDDDMNRYLVWLTDDFTDEKPTVNTLNVLLDGVSTNVDIALVGTAYALLLNSNCGVSTQGEHKIQIQAGSSFGEYTVTDDVVIYTHADGSINTTAPVYVTLGVSGGGWQGDDDMNRYLVWLTDDISGDKPTISSVTAEVNGESIAVPVALIDGKYALVLNESCGISALGEHSVQISAGQYFGSYIVNNGLTVYTHIDGSVDTSAPNTDPVAILSIDAQASLHNGVSYDILLNMSDPAFVLGAEFSVTVQVDGVSTPVTLKPAGAGKAILSCGEAVSKGDHTIEIPEGTVFGLRPLSKTFSLCTYATGIVEEVTRGQIFLNNATAMMGGDYGDSLYYDLSATITGANWLTNSIPTDGNVTFAYVVNTDSKNDTTMVTGPVRMVDLSSGYPQVGGVMLIVTRDEVSSAFNVTDMALFYDAQGSIAYWKNSAGVMDLVPTSNGVLFYTEWDNYNTENTLTSKDFAGIDEKGAQYFGLGWNGDDNTVYNIDWTKVMVYDAEGNDLGVQWYNSEDAVVSLKLMADYGETIYLKPDDYQGLPVSGWKVTDRNGNVQTVTGVVTNGIHAITVPQNAVSFEPIYQTVTLNVENENGDGIYSASMHWLDSERSKTEKIVRNSIASGNVLLGYELNGELYNCLSDLPVDDTTVSLTVTAKTVSFCVQKQAEVRHEDTLEASGLRFVATLYAPEYPRILVLSDSKDKLTLDTADYKVGSSISSPYYQIESPDGSVSYTIALTNIDPADYNKTYYAAAAILVTYADGKSAYVYTEPVSSTVNEAALESTIHSESQLVYIDGVMHLDADSNLIGTYRYTISVSHNTNGDYVINYAGSHTQKVEALTIGGLSFGTEDGVIFGDNVITIPSALFASAMLQDELVETENALQIGAYRGPAIGLHTYTDSDGNVTDYSIVPRTHDAVYADLEDFFDAGFNIWMAEEWIYGATNYSNNDGLSALDLAAEYCINHGLTGEDIQVLITDSLLNGLLDGSTMPENAGSTVAEYAQIVSDRVNILKNYNPKVNGVEVGTEYNCFAGYILRDEPYYDHLDYYNGWFSFLAADTDQTVAVIANSASTGGQVSGTVSALGMLKDGYNLFFSLIGNGASKKYIVSGSTSEDPCTTEEFTAYLRKFVDGINSTVWNYSNMMLTSDSYGLNTNVSSSLFSTTVTSTNNVSEYWQENMALVASLVKEKNPDATFATVLRSFGMTRLNMWDSAKSFFGSENWTEYKKFDEAWGQQAMDMQAYTSLAHGYTYMSYFTYWEVQNQYYRGETFTDACVMWDDNMNPVKQDMYYWVKNTNAELRALENLIGNFSYNDTAAIAAGSSYYSGTEGLWTAAQLASNTAIASVSATVDTTVGHYTKETGDFGEMFILVNMSHPEEVSSDTVTVAFDSGYTGAIVYIDGVATMYQLTDGACTITIPSGEGVIVIPAK